MEEPQAEILRLRAELYQCRFDLSVARAELAIARRTIAALAGRDARRASRTNALGQVARCYG